jgi:putative intracellular protease/amidase
MSAPKRALIVVTSHNQLGQTGKQTGFYFDEMATPYWSMTDAGISVDIASIQGGNAPIDASSIGKEGERKPAVQRSLDDAPTMDKLVNTLKVSEVNPHEYNAVFLAGGHGTMWDFTDASLAALIGRAFDSGAIISTVCHGPAGLVHAKRANGRPVVEGHKINAFTNEEEEAVGLTNEVPFLLETELRNRGAKFENSGKFQSHAVRDGQLVTGQNPASVKAVADLLVAAMFEKQLNAA